jgi:cytoskeletal protein CcmA (bactofilin family)
MRSGTGLTINGELTAEEDLTIEGTFEGVIDLKGHRLTTGAESIVRASIAAGAVSVRGRLEGHVTATAVDLGPVAVVEASLIVERLSIEEGAMFNGSVNTERARAAATIARHRRTAVSA